MVGITVWRGVLGLVVCGLLSACVETAGTSAEGGAPAASARGSGAEIEMPEVFHAKESALWDGRPSLGGIWVASPDAVDPERVVMFNPATGKSVKGALFRRERENPGPRLQLSSDAAEALGVLAGMPVDIEVTALRKEEVEEPVEAVVAEPSAADPAAGQEADTGAAAVAAAALDAVDAGAAASETPIEGAPTAEGVAVEEEPKPKTRKEKRAEAKAAREAAKAAAEAEAAVTSQGAVTEESAASAEAVAVTEIETAPLDAGKPAVAAEVDITAKPAETQAAEAPAAEATDPAPTATGTTARTIQIGSFSKEENANRAVDALSKIGIAARAKKIEKDGKVIWGVMATGDDALLKKIKDAGFADAYFLK